MDIYREEIMDHFQNPRNQGEVEKPNGVARDANASCGDMIEMQVKLKEGKVGEVKWKGIGCAISTAAASKLTEWLVGKEWKKVQGMDETELVKIIGFEVNPGRRRCVTLPVRVLKKLEA